MENALKEEEYKINGEKEYIDTRGKISNYELTEPINWIGLITSKKGSLRANHYHPIQEQKAMLINGKFISVFKDLSDKGILKTHTILPGELVVTKPNVAHTMIFLEDSTFLNLVNGEREHENFGVHTIPYELVKQNAIEGYMKNYKSECRICGNEKLKRVISLGMVPLANNLIKENEKEECFPLEMNYCPQCHLCQLSYVVPPQKLFSNYLYVSSTTKSFKQHFEEFANRLVNELKLNNNSLVVDIGSNDGIFLKPLKEKGIKVVGIEPAKNICEIARKEGIETIEGFFNDKIVEDILTSKGEADVITASNVFAHADNIKEITRGAFKLLKDNGVFIIEVQYLINTIKDLTFDNIYHEHLSYYSVTSLNEFFKKQGLHIIKVEKIPTHGGSIRIYVKRNADNFDSSLSEFLDEEKKFGITNFGTYQKFAENIEAKKAQAIQKIRALKDKGKTIAGYGAPAKATTVLNFYGITNKDIDFIIEDNKLKHGYLVPGARIPIKDKAEMKNTPDCMLVLAWNFFDEIKKNNQDMIDKGVEFFTLRD